jgi:predicted unusual protein kinase regulating ubiquinone biosynthesis (AarF/ABC1/UbiB family)
MTHASTASIASYDPKTRRRVVEARLAALGRPRAARRPPPPEGRLAADEYLAGLAETLVDLGPVFASFGRYLSTRVDLLPRRETRELAAIEDRGAPLAPGEVTALVRQQLGGPIEERFYRFNAVPRATTLWKAQHDAWLSPDVPVLVTLVRPDAAVLLFADLPLLALLAPWLGVPAAAFAAAVDDFAQTLQRRLDQTLQAAAFIRLAADAAEGGAFVAPVCYRDFCAPGILTLERVDGRTLEIALATRQAPSAAMDRDAAGQRLTTAWLRQAVAGRVVPFDFDLRSVLASGDRLVLLDAAFEPQTSAGQVQFFAYLKAVAAADPDTAWAWVGGAAAPGPGGEPEEELRRRLRQAVPFRDGEWSGDDRLAEQALVQWRVTRESGWRLHPHQLHMFRGLHAVATAGARLSPSRDTLQAALESEQLRIGFGQARDLLDVRGLPTAMDKLLHDLIALPQKLDDVLTLAAEGRLAVKLTVPEAREAQRVRNRTISMVASLITLTGLALLMRHVVPAYGVYAERGGMVMLLAAGAWLLIAAARL